MKITPSTKIFLAGNPAELEISVAANAGERNTRAVVYLRLHNLVFGTGYSESHGAFRLTWRNGNFFQVFKYFSNPDNNGTSFHYQSFFNNDKKLYYAHILEKLKLNKELMKDFFIEEMHTATDDYIKLTAYLAGTHANITYDNQVYGIPFNVTGVSLTMAVTGSLKTALASRYVDFSIQVNKNSAQVRKNLIAYDERNDMFACIDLSKYVRDINPLTHFTFPEPNTKFVKHNILKEVRVLNNTTAYFNATLSSIFNKTFLAVPGKLIEMRESMLAASGKDFLAYLDNGTARRFLTNQPNPKTIDIYAPEKLYWIVPASGDYKIYVNKYFKCIEKLTASDPISLLENDVIEIPASYRFITAAEQYKIYKYDIYIQKISGSQKSETFTFIIDRKYERYARYFMVSNSLGGFDCLRTTGRVVDEDELEKTFVKQDRPARVRTGKSLLQTDSENSTNYVIETGLNDIAYNRHLRELVNSPDVFFLKGQKAYPVTIEKAKIKIDEGEPLQSQQLTISQLYHDDFTPDFTSLEPVLPDFNNDFNKDFLTFSWQNPGDYVPTADAGPDQDTVGDFVMLDANYPLDEMQGFWTKYSGPGNVTFVDSKNPKTKATFSAPGVYILRWTVVYGKCSEFDDQVSIRIILPTVQFSKQNQPIITATTTKVFAEVTADGFSPVTERGFIINGEKYVFGKGMGAFEASLQNLEHGAPNVVKAFATNKAGTAYTAEISLYPYLRAFAGDDYGSMFSHVPLSGNIPFRGCIGTWTVISAPAGVTFNESIHTPMQYVDLAAVGTYVFQWSVTDGKETVSDTVQITYAQPAENTVMTYAPEKISQYKYLLKGEVLNDGEYTILSRGFYYGQFYYFGSNDKAVVGSGIGAFEFETPELEFEKLYVQAYAECTGGFGNTGTWFIKMGNLQVVDLRTKSYYDAVNDRTYPILEVFMYGKTIQVMLENFDGTKYNDGTPIPVVTSDTEWGALTTGAMCYYGNDIANKANFGALYNSFEISRIAPAGGWRLPDVEFVNGLCSILEKDRYNVGMALKENNPLFWNNNTSTDDLPFYGRGSGVRRVDPMNKAVSYRGLKDYMTMWFQRTTGNGAVTLYANSNELALTNPDKYATPRPNCGYALRFIRTIE